MSSPGDGCPDTRPRYIHACESCVGCKLYSLLLEDSNDLLLEYSSLASFIWNHTALAISTYCGHLLSACFSGMSYGGPSIRVLLPFSVHVTNWTPLLFLWIEFPVWPWPSVIQVCTSRCMRCLYFGAQLSYCLKEPRFPYQDIGIRQSHNPCDLPGAYNTRIPSSDHKCFKMVDIALLWLLNIGEWVHASMPWVFLCSKIVLALSGHLSPFLLLILHHKSLHSFLVIKLYFMEVREGKDFEGSMLSNFSPSRGQQKCYMIPCAVSHQCFYVCHLTLMDAILLVVFSSSSFDQTLALTCWSNCQ